MAKPSKRYSVGDSIMTHDPLRDYARSLPIATRAWMERDTPHDGDVKPERNSGKMMRSASMRPAKWWRSVLICDTETTIEPTQRLTFGSYRFGTWRRDGTLVITEEGLFHANTLAAVDPEGFAFFSEYAAIHKPDTTGLNRNRDLAFRSCREFLDNVLWPAMQQDALIVGFHLPFDLSRIACNVSPARGRHQGGFSFVLWDYLNPETGKCKEHQFRPRVRVTQIDSKRSRMDITQPKGRPIGSNGKPVIYRPGFLDLRTLAFALTDRGYSLRSACDAFDVAQRKADPGEHGRITSDYIAYARQDVKATGSLLEALRADFDRHPIDLDPCRAMSPASIAKAYYRAMGITPRLAVQPDFSPELLGYAMSAYYGGRVECTIRRTPVPIVHTDVLSQYPSVNANMGLWRFHVAERIETQDCTSDVQSLLESVTPEMLLNPATWRRLHFFGQIVPCGDVVPVRAQYSANGGTFNIGVNPFHDEAPHWYAGPDLISTVLLTGQVPTVQQAFRLVPVGIQSSLRPVNLRGSVMVDPASDDFFKTVIEERKRVPKTDRLNKFLKVAANSGSYGVFVESNPEELKSGESAPVTVYGPDATPFLSQVTRPETPGTFSFPPVASLITAGARLVLALIERMVTDAGGSYTFCDTDSFAIVATEQGGLVPCPGGPLRMPDGRAAIKALSWATVDSIVAKLVSLNPYDRDAVPGSLLEIEDVNYDPESGARRQVWCLSIASKRYALFTKDDSGIPTILPGTTRHGLGYLVDPRDDADDSVKALGPWEHALRESIVRERLGLPPGLPQWHNRPAAMRHTVSSPWHLKAFDRVNHGKLYADRIKPFNFMLAVSLENQGRPDGIAATTPFHLVAAYESNPRRWTQRNWTDLYSGNRYGITTAMPGDSQGVAGVKSLGAVAGSYPYHPESKRCGPDGEPCRKRTEGVLSRRPVYAAGSVCIGKEAHRLDERDLVAGLDELQSIFTDPRREPWTVHVLPRLRMLARQPGGEDALMSATGLKSRALRDVLAGRSRPRKPVRISLVELVKEYIFIPTRHCLNCGATIEGSDSRQRYCSLSCRKRAQNIRRCANGRALTSNDYEHSPPALTQ